MTPITLYYEINLGYFVQFDSTETPPTHQQLGLFTEAVRQPVNANHEREKGRGARDHSTAVKCHCEPAKHLHHQQA